MAVDALLKAKMFGLGRNQIAKVRKMEILKFMAEENRHVSAHEIAKHLCEGLGRRQMSRIHSVIYRLKAEGYVSCSMCVYTITDKGRAALERQDF